jgi:hypothetical protein
MTSEPPPIRVKTVEPVRGYVLRLVFSDGTKRHVDLEPDLWGPMFEPLRDRELFRRVAVDNGLGTIVWPNGADMDPDGLHAAGSPRCT